jgi:tRNA uridine 5-carboxymethylaminomethyl modification enzyme
MVDRLKDLDTQRIPAGIDFRAVRGLRLECQHKLMEHQPATLGQASRISGVSPADIQVLMVHLRKLGK